jgi:transposase
VNQHTTTLFVGIDAHQNSLFLAVLPQCAEGCEPVRKIPNEPRAIRRQFARLMERGAVLAVYEAGCLGFHLQRLLRSLGASCEVAAPSLVPTKPGDRRKTDRLDARRLARYLRSGELSFVVAPTPEHEALRTLTRTREAFQQDLVRVRHRITKFLLTRGLHFRDGRNWTLKYMRWVKSIELPVADDRLTLDFLLSQLELREQSVAELDRRIERRAQEPDCVEQITTLRAFRGFDTVAAAAVHAELGDVRRFPSGSKLAGYTGLDDVERSSDGKGGRLGISRAGNRRLRRLLVEAAQHYRSTRTYAGKRLRKRRERSSPRAISIARKAERRLGAKHGRLAATKHTNVAKAAVARELAGFLWAALHPDLQQ